jgi:hypothetical protein
MAMNHNPLNNLEVSPSKGLPGASITMPGLTGATSGVSDVKWEKHRVRYQKLNLDEPGDVAELERIETKALHGRGVYVTSKERFPFMDKIYILVNYIEVIPADEAPDRTGFFVKQGERATPRPSFTAPGPATVETPLPEPAQVSTFMGEAPTKEDIASILSGRGLPDDSSPF